MARRKNVDGVAQSATEGPDVPALPKIREVIYTIVVPGCDDRVKIERARRVLKDLHVREAQIHIDAENGIVSCPRLYCFWRSEAVENEWQRKIKEQLPSAIIDVADWTPAPGYPKGDLSL